MSSNRPLAFLALILTLLAASLLLPPAAMGLDVETNQVLIEATLVSIENHDQVELGIDVLRPGERLDSALAADVQSRVTAAQASTSDAIDEILADPTFAASSNGVATLGLLNFTELLQDEMLAALSQGAKVKEISRPNLLAIDAQVAAIEISKGHPITQGPLEGKVRKRDAKAAGKFYESASVFGDVLAGLGITTNPLYGLFESYEGGKKKDIMTRVDLQDRENLKVRIKKGSLFMQGTEKDPVNASVVVSTTLPGEFTFLSRVMLPEKLSRKKQEALDGFSFGVEYASDRGSPPIHSTGYEVQFNQQGAAQAFTFADGLVLDIFPIISPDTDTIIMQIAVKNPDMITVGGILEFGNGTREMQTTEVPMLGDLPVVRYYLRNASKKNSVENTELMIFVTPKVISVP